MAGGSLAQIIEPSDAAIAALPKTVLEYSELRKRVL